MDQSNMPAQPAGKKKKEIPWCAIFLVAGALICHTMVLLGNFATAEVFVNIGKATGGWSDVGLGVSESMIKEVEHLMDETNHMLTDALGQVVQIQTMMSFVLGATGNTTQMAVTMMQTGDIEASKAMFPLNSLSLADVSMTPIALLADDAGQLSKAKSMNLAQQLPIKAAVQAEVTKVIGQLTTKVESFWKTIRPALVQVGKWLHSMGAKMQGFIEQFSQTIDKAQKIFDQLMAKLASSNKGIKPDLVYNTFNIFDVTHKGSIAPKDIQEVASLFGVTALKGAKGAALHKKYDEDGDGELDMKEYENMADDASIPGAMSYVLRTFSKKLAQIAGQLKGAKKRDEVAETVVEYFQLMVAKNLTKTRWVAEALTNGSMPIEFTADIFYQLSQQDRAPDKLTDLPVGQTIIGFMFELNPHYVTKAVKELADPVFWSKQGFDAKLQHPTIKTVKKWVKHAAKKAAEEKKKHKKEDKKDHNKEDKKDDKKKDKKDDKKKDKKDHKQDPKKEDKKDDKKDAKKDDKKDSKKSLLELDDSSTESLLAELDALTEEVIEKRIRHHQSNLKQERIKMHESVFYADATKVLFRNLLGEVGMKGAAVDADIERVTKGGVAAKPETLKFAEYLVNNATATAQRFQADAFDFAKTSSNAIDNFANQIQAFIKKVEQFLDLMMAYTTERGIHQLHLQINKFIEEAGKDVAQVVDKLINKMLLSEDNMGMQAGMISTLSLGSKQELGTAGVFTIVSDLLNTMSSILPTVITDVKFAKKEVSSVASTLKSIFAMFKSKGTGIFDEVASMYKTVWLMYYIMFFILTLLILFYAFWAYDWFADDDDAAQRAPPPTDRNFCIKCWTGCLDCLRDGQDTDLCFWSCILISELVILIMFIVSVVFCVLAGIKAFVNFGCAEIYVLGDDPVCTNILIGIKDWMSTFWDDMPSNIHDACEVRTLVACQAISHELMSSAMQTVGGSFAAAAFSFQLLFLSAKLHERARYNHVIEAMVAKELGED